MSKTAEEKKKMQERIKLYKSIPVPSITAWKEWEVTHLCKYLLHRGISEEYVNFIFDKSIKPRTLIDFSKKSDADGNKLFKKKAGKKKRTTKEKKEDQTMGYEFGYFVVSGFDNYIQLSELHKVVREFEVNILLY